MQEKNHMTIGRAVRSILPTGTIEYLGLQQDAADNLDLRKKSSPTAWSVPPVWPTDLFVTAAHLIHSSGLLTYFNPDPDFVPSSDSPLAFTLTAAERAECAAAGASWSEDPDSRKAFELVFKLWSSIVSRHWNKPLRASTYAQGTSPRTPLWWKQFVQLLLIADEACVGLGAPRADETQTKWLVQSFETMSSRPFLGGRKLGRNAYRARRQPTTYGIDTDPDVACIQPKGRISAVGCNLRNLTRNASYIPHAGTLRCHWMQPISSAASEADDALDILIVPVPLVLEEAAWQRSSTAVPDQGKRPNWGNFELEQTWLGDKARIIEYTLDKVRKAKRTLRKNPLNGIIFPEYALDEPLFNQLCEEVKKIEPLLEFAVTGSSSNCDGEKGNFVLTALWDVRQNGSRASRYLLTSRRKHHRWRLSPDQVTSYGLEAALPPPASWWESHFIAQREIHLFHFRKTSVFTTMICEDLARSDPCHDILRAIGPNLLFALLMDGPQIASRWPSRYAATLADDPGTSVLTVTSMGLLKRGNDTKRYPENRTVALWRDETGKTRELAVDQDDSALLLSLSAVPVEDQTLDGRTKTDQWSWRYESHRSV